MPDAQTDRLGIELHVEELVLDGFDPGVCYRIGEGIGQELTRLLTEHAAPTANTLASEIASVDGGEVTLEKNPMQK